jgi:hypothetical protein
MSTNVQPTGPETRMHRSKKNGFVKVPKTILYHRDLKPGPRLLWAAIRDYRWGDDETFVALETLSFQLNVNYRTARRWARQLEAVGLVRMHPRAGRSFLLTEIEPETPTLDKKPGDPGQNADGTLDKMPTDKDSINKDSSTKDEASKAPKPNFDIPKELCPYDSDCNLNHQLTAYEIECVACTDWVPAYRECHGSVWDRLIKDFSPRTVFAVMEAFEANEARIGNPASWARSVAESKEPEMRAQVRREYNELLNICPECKGLDGSATSSVCVCDAIAA